MNSIKQFVQRCFTGSEVQPQQPSIDSRYTKRIATLVEAYNQNDTCIIPSHRHVYTFDGSLYSSSETHEHADHKGWHRRGSFMMESPLDTQQYDRKHMISALEQTATVHKRSMPSRLTCSGVRPNPVTSHVLPA